MPPRRIGRFDTARGSTRSAVEQRCALASAVARTFDRVAARRRARRTPVVPGRAARALARPMLDSRAGAATGHLSSTTRLTVRWRDTGRPRCPNRNLF